NVCQIWHNQGRGVIFLFRMETPKVVGLPPFHALGPVKFLHGDISLKVPEVVLCSQCKMSLSRGENDAEANIVIHIVNWDCDYPRDKTTKESDCKFYDLGISIDQGDPI